MGSLAIGLAGGAMPGIGAAISGGAPPSSLTSGDGGSGCSPGDDGGFGWSGFGGSELVTRVPPSPRAARRAGGSVLGLLCRW
jgi:hypothetical protein